MPNYLKRLKHEAITGAGSLLSHWDMVEKYADKIDGKNPEDGIARRKKGEIGRWAIWIASAAIFIGITAAGAGLPLPAIIGLYGALGAANIVFSVWTMRGNHSGIAKLERKQRDLCGKIRDIYEIFPELGKYAEPKLGFMAKLKAALFSRTPIPRFPAEDFAADTCDLDAKKTAANDNLVNRWRKFTLVTGGVGVCASIASSLIGAIHPIASIAIGSIGRVMSLFNLGSLRPLSEQREEVARKKITHYEKHLSDATTQAKEIDPARFTKLEQRWKILDQIMDGLKLNPARSSTARLRIELDKVIESAQDQSIPATRIVGDIFRYLYKNEIVKSYRENGIEKSFINKDKIIEMANHGFLKSSRIDSGYQCMTREMQRDIAKTSPQDESQTHHHHHHRCSHSHHFQTMARRGQDVQKTVHTR